MRQLTVQRVTTITLFVLVFTLAMRIPVDTDTWWHIRSGEHTLNEGFIYEDPFSHTKFGERWINHSWGAQIILFLAWQQAGNAGLALYTALLATAGMAMLYMISAGNVYVRSFIVVLGAATAAVFWSPRPQMISFFFSTVILYILYLNRYRREDHLWYIVPLMWLWGNMHAGFSIGYIFIGATIVGEFTGGVVNRDKSDLMTPRAIRKLIIVSMISVMALVVNPYGFRIWLVPFETVSMGALREFIQEWNSPNFQERQTWPFVLMVIALFGLLGASKQPLGWTNFFLISGTTFMALTAGRNIAVFAVAATPVLSYHANAVLKDRGWVLKPARYATVRQAQVNLVLLMLIVVGALVNMLTVLNPETVDEAQRERLPVQAAEFIEAEGLRGPMFNSYNWGGYLMFALPNMPVYVDGRTDLYKDDFLTRYLQTVIGSNDWRRILDVDGINMVVIESGSNLARNLADEPGWTRVYPNPAYPDDARSIFIRDEPLNGTSDEN